MSYILDALKKLEQKRRQEETVTLLASQGHLRTKPRPRRVWIYVILAALVLNAAAIAWWIGPWKPAARSVPRKSSVAREAKPPSPPAASVETQMETEYIGANQPSQPEVKQPSQPEVTQPSPDTAAKESPRAPQQAKNSVFVPAGTPPAGGKAQARPPAAAPKPAAVQKPAPVEQAYAEPATPAEPKPPRDGRVLKIADLPPSVSNGLPELRMSLHYYIGDSKTRFARINDKTLREGETLGEGVKVDEITPAGVVLNRRGWRFLLPILNEK